MASPTRYVKGDWKTVCDVCGQRYLASQLKKRWDGLMVCNNDWEPRQPQDFVRAKVDIQAVPFTRPESTDYNFELACSTYSSLAGFATAGCMIAGNPSNPGVALTGTFTV